MNALKKSAVAPEVYIPEIKAAAKYASYSRTIGINSKEDCNNTFNSYKSKLNTYIENEIASNPHGRDKIFANLLVKFFTSFDFHKENKESFSSFKHSLDNDHSSKFPSEELKIISGNRGEWTFWNRQATFVRTWIESLATLLEIAKCHQLIQIDDDMYTTIISKNIKTLKPDAIINILRGKVILINDKEEQRLVNLFIEQLDVKRNRLNYVKQFNLNSLAINIASKGLIPNQWEIINQTKAIKTQVKQIGVNSKKVQTVFTNIIQQQEAILTQTQNEVNQVNEQSLQQINQLFDNTKQQIEESLSNLLKRINQIKIHDIINDSYMDTKDKMEIDTQLSTMRHEIALDVISKQNDMKTMTVNQIREFTMKIEGDNHYFQPCQNIVNNLIKIYTNMYEKQKSDIMNKFTDEIEVIRNKIQFSNNEDQRIELQNTLNTINDAMCDLDTTFNNEFNKKIQSSQELGVELEKIRTTFYTDILTYATALTNNIYAQIKENINIIKNNIIKEHGLNDYNYNDSDSEQIKQKKLDCKRAIDLFDIIVDRLITNQDALFKLDDCYSIFQNSIDQQNDTLIKDINIKMRDLSTKVSDLCKQFNEEIYQLKINIDTLAGTKNQQIKDICENVKLVTNDCKLIQIYHKQDKIDNIKLKESTKLDEEIENVMLIIEYYHRLAKQLNAESKDDLSEQMAASASLITNFDLSQNKNISILQNCDVFKSLQNKLAQLLAIKDEIKAFDLQNKGNNNSNAIQKFISNVNLQNNLSITETKTQSYINLNPYLQEDFDKIKNKVSELNKSNDLIVDIVKKTNILNTLEINLQKVEKVLFNIYLLESQSDTSKITILLDETHIIKQIKDLIIFFKSDRIFTNNDLLEQFLKMLNCNHEIHRLLAIKYDNFQNNFFQDKRIDNDINIAQTRKNKKNKKQNDLMCDTINFDNFFKLFVDRFIFEINMQPIAISNEYHRFSISKIDEVMQKSLVELSVCAGNEYKQYAKYDDSNIPFALVRQMCFIIKLYKNPDINNAEEGITQVNDMHIKLKSHIEIIASQVVNFIDGDSLDAIIDLECDNICKEFNDNINKLNIQLETLQDTNNTQNLNPSKEIEKKKKDILYKLERIKDNRKDMYINIHNAIDYNYGFIVGAQATTQKLLKFFNVNTDFATTMVSSLFNLQFALSLATNSRSKRLKEILIDHKI